MPKKRRVLPWPGPTATSTASAVSTRHSGRAVKSREPSDPTPTDELETALTDVTSKPQRKRTASDAAKGVKVRPTYELGRKGFTGQKDTWELAARTAAQVRQHIYLAMLEEAEGYQRPTSDGAESGIRDSLSRGFDDDVFSGACILRSIQLRGQ
jgi:hypothetical protein